MRCATVIQIHAKHRLRLQRQTPTARREHSALVAALTGARSPLQRPSTKLLAPKNDMEISHSGRTSFFKTFVHGAAALEFESLRRRAALRRSRHNLDRRWARASRDDDNSLPRVAVSADHHVECLSVFEIEHEFRAENMLLRALLPSIRTILITMGRDPSDDVGHHRRDRRTALVDDLPSYCEINVGVPAPGVASVLHKMSNARDR